MQVTVAGLESLFGITPPSTLPNGVTGRLQVLSDERLMLSYGEDVQYTLTISYGAGEVPLQFIDRGYSSDGTAFVDIRFTSTPDYENPDYIGEFGIMNTVSLSLRIAEMDTYSGYKGRIIHITNDETDDAVVVPRNTIDGVSIRTFSLAENKQEVAFTISGDDLPDGKFDNYLATDESTGTLSMTNGGGSTVYKVNLGGGDARHFRMHEGHDGIYIMFKHRLDYDAPNDHDWNGKYEIEYVITDESGSTEISRQKYEITITEAPSTSVPPATGGQSVVPLGADGGPEPLGGPAGIDDLNTPMPLDMI